MKTLDESIEFAVRNYDHGCSFRYAIWAVHMMLSVSYDVPVMQVQQKMQEVLDRQAAERRAATKKKHQEENEQRRLANIARRTQEAQTNG